jgi:hypothetical protein
MAARFEALSRPGPTAYYSPRLPVPEPTNSAKPSHSPEGESEKSRAPASFSAVR